MPSPKRSREAARGATVFILISISFYIEFNDGCLAQSGAAKRPGERLYLELFSFGI
jgi:hypothetical protein